MAHADARDNRDFDRSESRHFWSNSWIVRELEFFTQMAKHGILPDFTRAEDLAKNKHGIKLLFIPYISYISEEEMKMIEEFEKSGGEIVYVNEQYTDSLSGAYETRKIKRTKFTGLVDAADLLYGFNISPTVSFNKTEETLMLQTLDTEEGYLAVVTNIENLPRPSVAPTLCVPSDVKGAIYESFDKPEGKELKIKNGKIKLPKISDGCFVRLIK